MFCAKCGASLKDDAMQCDKCGAPVRIRPAAETKGEGSSWFSVPDGEALEGRRPDAGEQGGRKQKREEKNSGREDTFRDPVYYEDVTDELDVGEILRIVRGQEGSAEKGSAPEREGPSGAFSGIRQEQEAFPGAGDRAFPGAGDRTSEKTAPGFSESYAETFKEPDKESYKVSYGDPFSETDEDDFESEDRYGGAACSEDLYGEDSYDMEDVPLPLMERIRRRLAEAHHVRAEAADEKAMARHLARAEKYYDLQESMADRLREERAQKAEELRLRRIRQDEEWHEQKWFEEALRKELEEERAAKRASEERLEQERAAKRASEERLEQERAAKRASEERLEQERAANRTSEDRLEQERRAWREEAASLRREAEAPEEPKDILAKETKAREVESARSAWEKQARREENARPAWEKQARGEGSARPAWEQKAPEEDLFYTGQDTDVRAEEHTHTRTYSGTAEPVSALDEAYLRKVRAARARRRAQEDAQDGFELFLGKYGLTKEVAVRIATLFLIAVLSMIYVLGRGGSSANAGSLPADGMTGTPALAEPDAGGEETEEESAVPTGGGDFQ